MTREELREQIERCITTNRPISASVAKEMYDYISRLEAGFDAVVGFIVAKGHFKAEEMREAFEKGAGIFEPPELMAGVPRDGKAKTY